jgi:hypothetical protein
VQFSTGHVGVHTLRQIIEDPGLELVGVHANSPGKIGKDAAELCGLTGPTGVVATDDVASLVALAADCVVYTTQAETRPDKALPEVLAFLEAGTNVVASSFVWLIHPDHADEWLREPIAAACRAGGSSMFVTGIDPGFSGDVLPLAALQLAQSATRVTVQEIFDYGTYDDAEFTGASMGFGFGPDADPPLMFLPGVLTSIWGGPVKVLARELGVSLDEITERVETWHTPEEIDCTMMTVPAGHVAAVRFAIQGISDGEVVISLEHVNRLTEGAAPDWPYPPDGRPGVHRVVVEGRPGVEINTHVGLHGVDQNEAGVISTGAKLVNAVRSVCAAPPGLLGVTDLPLSQAAGLVR